MNLQYHNIKHSQYKILITISQVVGQTQLLPCVTRIQTGNNTVTKHGCLTLVQNDTYYLREGTPVSAPIPGDARQTSGDMFNENENVNSKIQRPKLNFYLLDMPRHLCRSLLKTNSWRRSSSLLPQAEVESESWTQDEKIKTGVETRAIETKAFPQRKPQKATPMPFTSPRWPINRR